MGIKEFGKIKQKAKKIMKEIEKYSDITDNDCVFLSGKNTERDVFKS